MSNPTETLFNLLNKRGYTDAVFTEVERLIAAGADVNYRQEKYPFETTLCRALDDWDEQNVLRMTQLLVKHGADVNLPEDIFYPIWFAIQKNFLAVVDFLLMSGAEEGTDAAMQLAIEKNYIEIVKLFLAKGIDANPAYYGVASFLNACCEAYRCRNRSSDDLPGIETATLLLAAGADPNGEDCEGTHPFKNALNHDFFELADLLLKHGANIEQDGHTPVIFYAHTRASIEYLISKGVSINTLNQHGMNRLADAIQQTELELIPLLIENGIDLYAIDKNGYTPLHQAVLCENTKTLKLILPFYDLQKCNQIHPLETLSQENNIRSLLGLSLIESDIELPDNLLEFCQSDPVLLEAEFTQKFQPLNNTLLDEEGSFSGSAMYKDLMELEPLAKQIGLQSEALLKLYNALSLLQKKRGEIEDQIRFSQQALAINQHTQSLSIHDQVMLYKRIIEGFEEDGGWEQALEASIQQRPLADQDPELSGSQRLYLSQKQGYLLHEVARFQEALDLNLQTLKQAENEFGKDHPNIIYLLINIAQNQFELGQFAETEATLKRALTIASELDTADEEFELLFQLGVLAHETGDDKTAESYFLQYQALAEELEDDDYIERANILLEDLASKQS